MFEPSRIAGSVVQTKQAVNQESIVVQIGEDFRCRRLARRGAIGSQQSAIRVPEILEDKLGGPSCGFDECFIIQRFTRLGETSNHLPIPGGDYFRIQKWTRPFGTGFRESL